MRRLLLLLSCIAWLQLAFADGKAGPVFELTRTPCLGKCPNYTIRIYKNGYCTYAGGDFAELKGKYHKCIGRRKVKTLIRQFIKGGFFNFEEQYYEKGSDLPSAFISFTNRGKSLKIKDYGMAPESLHALENALDDVVSWGEWKPDVKP